MSRTPVSKLDFAREKYDKALKDLVAQIRTKMKKSSDAKTESMENLIKWLPESFEAWAQGIDDARKDFHNSSFANYVHIDWLCPTNKATIWANAHSVLKIEEQEEMKNWKKYASAG